MLVSCWSTKGGTGTTVVAAALALLLARTRAAALAVDLAGDLPLAFGLPCADGRDRSGIADWSGAAPQVPADALGRLEEPVTDALTLVRRGDGPMAAAAAPLLVSLLAADPRPVVVDCGRVDTGDSELARAVARAADRSLLVLRSCYLALRRSLDAPLPPSGVVLVIEPGRSLDAADVESVLGVPVVARVRVTDAIARAVDAGVLATRTPRTLIHDICHAA